MKDLISVIIPVYKVEEYINRCIDSVINQTYKNLEIILVDDGSPDGCPKICDEYAKKDSRIRVIHKQNGGLSDARNVGIDNANGKYITFIDSDDWIPIDSINILYKNLINTKSEISSGCLLEVFSDNRKNYSNNDYEVYSKIEGLKNLFLLHDISNSASGKIYDISLFDNIRYPVGKLYEDLGTTYKLFAKCKNVVSTKKIVYYYFQNSQSIMHKSYSSKRLQSLDFMYEQKKFIIDNLPEIEDYVDFRIFYECVLILNDMPYSSKDRVKLKHIIKKYRNEILKIEGLYFKQKLLCYSTYFGQFGIKIAFKIKTLRKKVIE